MPILGRRQPDIVVLYQCAADFLPVSLTQVTRQFTAGFAETGGKFTAGVCSNQCKYQKDVKTGVAVTSGIYAAVVNEAYGQLVACVINTGGVP